MLGLEQRPRPRDHSDGAKRAEVGRQTRVQEGLNHIVHAGLHRRGTAVQGSQDLGIALTEIGQNFRIPHRDRHAEGNSIRAYPVSFKVVLERKGTLGQTLYR